MNNSRIKILITGGTGFVGRAIIDELLKFEQFEIYCLVRNGRDSFNKRESDSINFIKGDITDLNSLVAGKFREKVDFLIHVAGLAHQFGATGEQQFQDINEKGTENICLWAESIGVEKIILISSVAVYGDHGSSEIDELFECRPVGAYARSKLAAEEKAFSFCKAKHIKLIALRLSTVIGEDDPGNLLRLIRSIDSRRFLWIGRGENKKSMIHKKDVARAVLTIILSKNTFETEIFNITSEAVTMREIVDEISLKLKKNIWPLVIPEKFVRSIFAFNKRLFSFENLSQIERTIDKWLSDDIFRGDKFNGVYGFRPLIPIREAIGSQVEKYLQTKK